MVVEQKQGIHIVWFKKDFRLSDHLPLASLQGVEEPVLLLYCFEPSLYTQPDVSLRHLQFAYQSINDLNANFLAPYQSQIYIVHNEAVACFELLQMYFNIISIRAHRETGTLPTFKRDIEVKNWCDSQNIIFKEFCTNGVRRGLKNRSDFREYWHKFMQSPIIPINLKNFKFLSLDSNSEASLSYEPLPLAFREYNSSMQKGGRSLALRYLASFYEKRISGYRRHISKPTESRVSCSRLSPYITYGCLSIREIYQLNEGKRKEGKFLMDMRQFISRLSWNPHFVQKFESEIRIEKEHFNKGFYKVPFNTNEEHYRAWELAKTGFPLVDASMRCVVATGFLNFRMRAMLVSFLTHSLRMDWRKGVHFLARQFLDYEPGIHHCQFQMQAGTIGTHTLRVYNPTKQAKDHDGEAIFIKKWVPELSNLPANLAIEPWLITPMEESFYQFAYGIDYPKRIINEDSPEAKAFKELMWALIKKDAEVAAERSRILFQHSNRD